MSVPSAFFCDYPLSLLNFERRPGSHVRRSDDTNIRGFSTGLVAAGKVFVFSFYDGVAGCLRRPVYGRRPFSENWLPDPFALIGSWPVSIVAEPLLAARADGKSGLFRGGAKAFLGLVLRPASGMFALFALPAKGASVGSELVSDNGLTPHFSSLALQASSARRGVGAISCSPRFARSAPARAKKRLL